MSLPASPSGCLQDHCPSYCHSVTMHHAPGARAWVGPLARQLGRYCPTESHTVMMMGLADCSCYTVERASGFLRLHIL